MEPLSWELRKALQTGARPRFADCKQVSAPCLHLAATVQYPYGNEYTLRANVTGGDYFWSDTIMVYYVE